MLAAYWNGVAMLAAYWNGVAMLPAYWNGVAMLAAYWNGVAMLAPYVGLLFLFDIFVHFDDPLCNMSFQKFNVL